MTFSIKTKNLIYINAVFIVGINSEKSYHSEGLIFPLHEPFFKEWLEKGHYFGQPRHISLSLCICCLWYTKPLYHFSWHHVLIQSLFICCLWNTKPLYHFCWDHVLIWTLLICWVYAKPLQFLVYLLTLIHKSTISKFKNLMNIKKNKYF